MHDKKLKQPLDPGTGAVTKDDPILAASPYCFGPFQPFVAYQGLAQLGIRFVEVPALPVSMAMRYDLPTFVPECLTDDDVKRLKGRLSDLGLTSITVGAFCDLLEPGQAEALRRRIDFAHQLGATYVITDATAQNEPGPRRQELVQTLRSLADYAAQRTIKIALEIHEGPTRNGKLAADFLDLVDHANVGVNYDTGNIYYYNDGIEAHDDVGHIAPRVVHVHLKDTLGGKGDWQFCALGDGRVQFPPILKALQAAGFRGPYSLEVEGIHGEDLNRDGYRRRVQKSLDYLNRIGLATGTQQNT